MAVAPKSSPNPPPAPVPQAPKVEPYPNIFFVEGKALGSSGEPLELGALAGPRSSRDPAGDKAGSGSFRNMGPLAKRCRVCGFDRRDEEDPRLRTPL
jgi:hypothetical protein